MSVNVTPNVRQHPSGLPSLQGDEFSFASQKQQQMDGRNQGVGESSTVLGSAANGPARKDTFVGPRAKKLMVAGWPGALAP